MIKLNLIKSEHINLQEKKMLPIELERPAKRACLGSGPSWGSVPYDIFYEIFKRILSHPKFDEVKNLNHFSLVCRHWVDYSARVRLVLTNVNRISMQRLFGCNRLGIQAFIANQQNSLISLNICGEDLPISLLDFKLTKLQTLSVIEPLESHFEWIAHLTQLSTLHFNIDGPRSAEFSADLYAKMLSCFAVMPSLTSLKAQGGDEHLDSNLTMLTKLTSLKTFNHQFAHLTDDGLKSLSLFSQLEQLDLNPSQAATPEGYKCLGLLTRLSKLELGYTSVGNALIDIQFIEKLVNLESLVIDSVHGIVVEELSWFSSLSNLQKLFLSEWDLTGDEFQFLQPLTKLEDLTLWRCGEIKLQHIASLTHLKRFDCRSASEQDLPLLSALTNLDDLELSDLEMTANFGFLKNLTQLASLSLCFSELSHHAFDSVACLRNLTCLNIAYCQFAEIALFHLGPLNKLQDLSIIESQITGLAFPILTRLTSLSSLNLSDSKITDAALVCLIPLTNLQSLDLSYTTTITDEAVASLSLLKSLTELNLDNWSVILSAERLFSLTSLQHLESLAMCVPELLLTTFETAFKHVNELRLSKK